MNIKSISEIVHDGDFVHIRLTVAVADFVKLVAGLQKKPVAAKKEKDAVSLLEDIKAKKAKFSSMVKEFDNKNPNLYPMGLYNRFYAYWTEPSRNGKKIRYEQEAFFDMAKRLSTFKNKTTPEEMSKLWEEHNLKKQQANGTKQE